MRTMRMEVVTVDEVIKEGVYPWNKGKNDIDYKGDIPGYMVGFCLEIKKADGSLGYASCQFVDKLENLTLYMADSYEEYNDIGCQKVPGMTRADWDVFITWDLCDRDGNQPTGRVVFRGYFEEKYDFEERDNYYVDKSEEVEQLFSQYVKEA